MTKMGDDVQAAVVGGGLIGLACAVNLQRSGLRTMLIAPISAEAASWGNAGHIATEQVEPLASFATVRSVHRRLFQRGGALGLPLRDIATWLPFSLRLLRASTPRRFAAGKAALSSLLAEALPAWRRLCDEVDEAGLLVEDGHFVVWETPATAAAGRARWLATPTGTATIRDATADEIAAIAAQTSVPVAGAIRFAGTAQIADLPALAAALEARFVALGGARRRASVAAILPGAGGHVLRLDDGLEIAPEVSVLAAGAASGRLLAPLGIRAPIVAERGYHIQSAGSAWPETLPPVVFEDRATIVTRFRGGLRAASFVEFGRAESPPDPAKWRRLRTHVAALGLSFPEPTSEWMGARPTLPDYLPAIGRSTTVPGLLYAFGHQHLGLTLAAVTGEAVRALATGEAPALPLAPFDLDRFG